MSLKPYYVSVLVMDEDPAVLVFTARVLEGSGIRALLARTADEAIGLAKMNYVPMDIVLANKAMLAADTDLLKRIQEFRPAIRHLSMAAAVDGDVIRVQPLNSDRSLVEQIRTLATTPLIRNAAN